MSWFQTGRGYLLTLILLVLAGAAAWWSLVQPWDAEVSRNAFSTNVTYLTGQELYPLAAVAAWVALACSLALIATKGIGRRFVGGIVFVTAIPLLYADLVGLSEVDVQAQVALLPRFVVGFAGCLLLLLGVLIWLYGPDWPGMSARQSGQRNAPSSMWDQLDQGEDPTK